MQEKTTTIHRILSIPEARRRLAGKSRSWFYDMISPKSPRHDPSFPRLIRFGRRSVGVLEEDLNAWIQSCYQNDEK
jgi:prophage regulatory protein